MGRDCHRLGGRGGDGCGAISSSKSKRKANAANGCMAAFYHLFDFQHFYFTSHHHHQHLTIDSPSRSKGLKLTEESPPSTTYKDKQSLNIPVSMRVRTETGTISSRLRAFVTDTSTSSSSEICNSPGSKTPSLVARLMGLDLLPDKTDLNHSLTNLHTTMTHPGSSRLTSHRLSKKGTRLGTRSLPESPRISSARKSDFDIHRLSLQLSKENKHEEFGCSRLKMMRQDQEENRSPRDYARQIVKQIKERVITRRVVGTDITNSVKNRDARPSENSNELRRDTTVSCSPRTRFSDKENRARTSHKPNSSSSFTTEQITQKPKPKPKPKPTTVILVSVSKAFGGEKQSKKRVKQMELRPINQCKKAESEKRFSPHPIKPSPTQDIRIKPQERYFSESREAKASNPLHRKKFKKTPKSSDLVNISATEPPQKQINETVGEGLKSNEEASFWSSLMHKIEENSPQVARNHKLNDTATIASSGAVIESEQEYIRRTMKLAGIITNTDSPDSSATMLDPSIFHKLEDSGENQSGSLALRCNRRLLFDLASEILTETAKRRRNYHGSELIGELCSAVSRYSGKRCPVPEEIASIEFDRLLGKKKKLEEEGEEEIVAEIERDIIDALVGETASELSLHRRRIKTTTDVKLSY